MKIAALAGGVGGAKLTDGIARSGLVESITVIVNTGDDFEHFGLHISPDLDTICYNLAGFADPQTGWGRANETWDTLAEINQLGGPDWFRLGNKDLATHLERTRRLRMGEPLSAVTADFCRRWGITAGVYPMSDNPVPTIVISDQGELSFQDYFVKLKCEPQVKGFEYLGVEKAKPAPGVLESIDMADFVIICPSNPWVSIGPILAVPGILEAIQRKPVLAVSPIIRGKAVKGPAAKMYREMGFTPSALAVAEGYSEMLDGFIIDSQDQDLIPVLRKSSAGKYRVFDADTWMETRSDRVRFAKRVIEFGQIILQEA